MTDIPSADSSVPGRFAISARVVGDGLELDLLPQPEVLVHGVIRASVLAYLVDAAAGMHLAPDGTETTLGRAATVANLFGADIPLATVARRGAGYRIHHRLTRLDPEGAHLIRVGDPIDIG